MRDFIIIIVVAIAIWIASLLAGCTTGQIQTACQADAIGQPLVTGLAVPATTLADPSAAPATAEAVALDDAALHPAVQAACAAAVPK